MVTPEKSVVSMLQSKKSLLFGLVIVAVAAGLFGWRAWKLGAMSTREWPELQGGVYSESVRFEGTEYLVPPNEIFDSGLGKDGHPRLMDPELTDVTTADEKLINEVRGLAVEVNGTYAFYPFQVLNWHEVVHDTLGDKSLLITYSSLTGSAVVYEPLVDGEERRFGDAGKIYNNATLLYDETTDTFWNQTSGQAIVGKDIGKTLTIYPSMVMRWDEFRETHTNGLVLSTETGYTRDYGRHPYGGYETSPGVFFPLNNVGEGLPMKDQVYRVDHPSGVAIFSERYLAFQKEPNVTLGEGEGAVHAAAFMDYDTFTTRVFDRRLGDRVLTFYREGRTTIKDRETESTWSLEGVALRGELSGQRLSLLPTSRHYAFAHYAMFPDTILSGQELLIPEKESENEEEGVLNIDENVSE